MRITSTFGDALRRPHVPDRWELRVRVLRVEGDQARMLDVGNRKTRSVNLVVSTHDVSAPLATIRLVDIRYGSITHLGSVFTCAFRSPPSPLHVGSSDRRPDDR